MSFYDTRIREKMLFDFGRDAAELRRFVRVNFRRGRTDVSKLRINKNNFTHIYRKWREAVYPFIDALKSAMKVLARQIEPKVYEYGFLRK